MFPVCQLKSCGERHDPMLRCEVAARIKAATVVVPQTECSVVHNPQSFDVDRGSGVVLGKTANRRSREAYNAYQREYMKKHYQKKGKA